MIDQDTSGQPTLAGDSPVAATPTNRLPLMSEDEPDLNVAAPDGEADKDPETVVAERLAAAEAEAAKQQVARMMRIANMDLPEAVLDGAPPWALLPPGFVFPRGKQVLFIRFKSEWTDAPWLGAPIIDPKTGKPEIDGNGKEVLYRQCVVWSINSADRRMALQRSQRDPNRAPEEMAKQMIRVHDGLQCDWSIVRQNGIEMFWNELSEKCRHMMIRLFQKLHVLDTRSASDFLENCIEVRSSGA